jgi:hypothetical protein
MRLDIFISSFSMTFNNSQKKQLNLLIEDYKLDSSKQRLKLIESFLTAGKKKEELENKLTRLIGPKAIASSDELRLIELNNEIRLIQGEHGSNQQAYRKDPNYIAFIEELKELEDKLGYNDKDIDAQAKSEVAILRGCLGDWNKQGSYSWEILNGSMPQFTVQSLGGKRNTTCWDMTLLIGWLEKHSGQKARKFKITNTIAGGNPKQAWILVDVRSGLPAASPVSMTNANTGADLTAQLGAVGLF